MATNTNIAAVPLYPVGGTTNEGYKIAVIDSGAKAAQNDTWTITNASSIVWAGITLDATGAAEAHTISSNVITLTGATGTACSGIIVYR